MDIETRIESARRAQDEAWNIYVDAERLVKSLWLERAHEQALAENDLRNKISHARAEADRLMLMPNAGLSEAYRQALKTYADLRAELIRMNPGAI